MTDTRYLIARFSSASFDEDARFLVPEGPTTLACVRRYAARAEETGDGHASFRVVYLPERRGAADREAVADLIEFIALNATDGTDEEVDAAEAELRQEMHYPPLVCVEFRYVDRVDDFLLELPGRDPTEHAEAVLAAWLEHTGKSMSESDNQGELPDPDLSEHINDAPVEDDAEEWTVTRVDVFTDRVYVAARPYRGEDVTFSFAPPEA